MRLSLVKRTRADINLEHFEHLMALVPRTLRHLSVSSNFEVWQENLYHAISLPFRHLETLTVVQYHTHSKSTLAKAARSLPRIAHSLRSEVKGLIFELLI